MASPITTTTTVKVVVLTPVSAVMGERVEAAAMVMVPRVGMDKWHLSRAPSARRTAI